MGIISPEQWLLPDWLPSASLTASAILPLSGEVSVTYTNKTIYYIHISETTLELSVFWPSDTESRINKLRFSESISLSFKTRPTSVTIFCGDVM